MSSLHWLPSVKWWFSLPSPSHYHHWLLSFGLLGIPDGLFWGGAGEEERNRVVLGLRGLASQRGRETTHNWFLKIVSSSIHCKRLSKPRRLWSATLRTCIFTWTSGLGAHWSPVAPSILSCLLELSFFLKCQCIGSKMTGKAKTVLRTNVT